MVGDIGPTCLVLLPVFVVSCCVYVCVVCVLCVCVLGGGAFWCARHNDRMDHGSTGYLSFLCCCVPSAGEHQYNLV